MQQPTRAFFLVHWKRGDENIPVLFNPNELTFEKSAQISEVNIPGLDSPLLQFVRGQAETLSVELFFDTTEGGLSEGAASVTDETDKIYQLLKIETGRWAPPVCEFCWNPKFPGAAFSEKLGGAQSRSSFRGVVESVSQRFTLFSSEGVPLRATLSVSLREYKTLEDQIAQLDLASQQRTQSQTIQQGETLSGAAQRQCGDSAEWRNVAEANGIEDPRRVTAGQPLEIPPTET